MPIKKKPGSDDSTGAVGQDRPSQGEQDHKRPKASKGEPAYRAEQNAPRRKFNPATELRQKGARGAKPSQKSKGR